MYATCRVHVSHVSRLADGELPDETLFELVLVYAVFVVKHVSLLDWYVLVYSLDTTSSLLLCTQDISRELLHYQVYLMGLYYRLCRPLCIGGIHTRRVYDVHAGSSAALMKTMPDACLDAPLAAYYVDLSGV